MKFFSINFLLFIVVVTISNGQTKIPNYFEDRNKSDKPRLVGEFLKEEIIVLVGEQLYKSLDLWEQSGAKNIKIDEPPLNQKSKDFLKNISIFDAGIVIEGFIKVVYYGKNESIVQILLVTNLQKGDYFLNKFSNLNGQYEPINTTNKNIVSQGNYFFDDYIIKITEKNNETIEFSITKNPTYNLQRKR